MELWQVIYLVIVGAGFGVGWYVSPLTAVVLVWAAIIIAEIIHSRKEMREFMSRAGEEPEEVPGEESSGEEG